AITTSSAPQTVTTTAATRSAAATSAPAASAPAAAATTVSFVGWDDQTTLNLMQRFFDQQFTPQYPTIKLQVTSTAGGDFNSKVIAEIAGGSPPDIMYVQDYMAADWVQQNVLTDLSTMANSEKNSPVAANWPQAIQFFQIQGKLYGLPKDLSSMVIYYNKDLLQGNGVTPPDNTGWTWDAFLQACHKLSKTGANGQQWGFTLRTFSDSGFGPWIWQNGGDFFADPKQPTQFTLDQAAAVDALQWYADLRNKEQVAPTTAQMKGQGDMFAKGQVAMQQNWSSAMVGLRTSVKSFTWDVAPMPRQKQDAISMSVVALGITRTSKQQTAAWEAIKFYNGPTGSQFTLQSGWGIPPDKSVASSAAFLKDTPPQNKQVFLDQLQYARLWPETFLWPQQRSLIITALNPVWEGTKDAHTAITTVKPQVLAVKAAQ
ncbi:MAG TPA: sugar ABC transporter substrate-binding protein, partial [Chloroflexota bacterium]